VWLRGPGLLASSNKIHHHTVFQHLFLEVLSEQNGIGGLRPVIGPFFVLINISLPEVKGVTSGFRGRVHQFQVLSTRFKNTEREAKNGPT
jgi:hypothetical protein